MDGDSVNIHTQNSDERKIETETGRRRKRENPAAAKTRGWNSHPNRFFSKKRTADVKPGAPAESREPPQKHGAGSRQQIN